MICGYRILIQKRPIYITIYKILQLVYFKYSILTNHGHIINFTLVRYLSFPSTPVNYSDTGWLARWGSGRDLNPGTFARQSSGVSPFQCAVAQLVESLRRNRLCVLDTMSVCQLCEFGCLWTWLDKAVPVHVYWEWEAKLLVAVRHSKCKCVSVL